ncbi:hypothetical protein PGB90_009558 [Kerria lacca]
MSSEIKYCVIGWYVSAEKTRFITNCCFNGNCHKDLSKSLKINLNFFFLQNYVSVFKQQNFLFLGNSVRK